MENASDALKMAFAIFVFIVALSIIFALMTQIKDTADKVLWSSDKTNYYEWATETTENGRLVGEEAIISSLHSQAKEQIVIKIIDGSSVNVFTGASLESDKKAYIENSLSSGTKEFRERVVEITTGGVYRTAEDGTKITITPGIVRAYIIYTRV